ncbi:MAG: hypothetical protein NTW80_09285 [Deltaproteobacteria bacterium]|nr:hypothetical protein [Deltaproteobacteria bacterium]
MFLSLLLLVAGVGTTSATIYFSDDFSGTTTSSAWSGSANSLESVQSYNGLGSGSNVFRGNFLRNESGGYNSTATYSVVPQTPTVLTLTGLSEHTSVRLGFLLAIIGSWDGSSTGEISGYTVGPDYFNVKVDGRSIFSQTFTNFSDGSQSYSGAKLGGLSARGFNPNWLDSAYDMSLDIIHTDSDLTVEWFASGDGWQGKNAFFGTTHDESWAIDNVSIDLINSSPVPLPPTLLLLCSGLLGLAGWRRLRKG